MFRCLVHTSLQWSCKVDVIPSGFNEESLRALSGLHSREWRLADSLGTLLQSHIKLPDFSSDFINSKKMIISSMSIAVVGEVPVLSWLFSCTYHICLRVWWFVPFLITYAGDTALDSKEEHKVSLKVECVEYMWYKRHIKIHLNF